eukprot:SAG31_NODE_3869_length_3799_cov_1.602432_3_plen_356_part_00
MGQCRGRKVAEPRVSMRKPIDVSNSSRYGSNRSSMVDLPGAASLLPRESVIEAAKKCGLFCGQRGRRLLRLTYAMVVVATAAAAPAVAEALPYEKVPSLEAAAGLGPPSKSPQTAQYAFNVPPPCSLNGVGAPCVCDPGWTGPNCGQLNLLPAPPLASQVTALSATTSTNQVANSTWGMSVVGPDSRGIFHGYMTEIANHCPLGDYGSASQVVHMTATHPLGPWTRKGVALFGFAHNPQAVLWEGKILLFHIGKQLDPGCLKNCGKVSPKPAESHCPDLSHATSVAVADKFEGPWTRYSYILGDKPTNPAPLICEYPTAVLLLLAVFYCVNSFATTVVWVSSGKWYHNSRHAPNK